MTLNSHRCDVGLFFKEKASRAWSFVCAYSETALERPIMLVIKSDPERQVHVPGVPAPVHRPVEIDSSMTGFTVLRTLRVYRFDRGVAIEGHAEEDEVLIVVLSGSIELTMTVGTAVETSDFVTLSAPDRPGVACAAYLPPHAAYKLIPRVDAEVAYARATPVQGRPARVFFSSAGAARDGVSVLLDEPGHAERLRMRLMQGNAQQSELSFAPRSEVERDGEALLFIKTVPESQRTSASCDDNEVPDGLGSMDTLALSPGERLTLTAGCGSTVLVLVLTAA